MNATGLGWQRAKGIFLFKSQFMNRTNEFVEQKFSQIFWNETRLRCQGAELFLIKSKNFWKFVLNTKIPGYFDPGIQLSLTDYPQIEWKSYKSLSNPKINFHCLITHNYDENSLNLKLDEKYYYGDWCHDIYRHL